MLKKGLGEKAALEQSPKWSEEGSVGKLWKKPGDKTKFTCLVAANVARKEQTNQKSEERTHAVARYDIWTVGFYSEHPGGQGSLQAEEVTVSDRLFQKLSGAAVWGTLRWGEG
jgi:hypothetical protein